MKNREECDREGKQRGICIRKEKREGSDTHVMDTRWETEKNAIHRENREEYVLGRGEGGNARDKYCTRW
jgi:hypothetical protein